MFTKFINLPVFLVSFAIGLVFIRLSSPDTKTVFVYPTPDNIGLLEYKDRAENCFGYEYDTIKCPKDKKETRDIPPQMGRSEPTTIKANKIQIGNTTISKF